MLKKTNDFLAGLPMTIVAGIFLLLDLVPHLMEEFGNAPVQLLFTHCFLSSRSWQEMRPM